HLRAGADKELHLHLLKLPHTEDKLPGNDFISKGFSDLSDTKSHLHPRRLLHIEEIDKYPLGSFRPQVDGRRILCYRTHLGTKHQVELPYLGPIAGTGNRTDDSFL